MKIKIIFLSFVLILSVNDLLTAQEAQGLFSRAVQFAKAGQNDFAFMQYRAILDNAAQLEHEDEALFACGEYFYMNSNYADAQKSFREYLAKKHRDVNKLFALAYLLKIAQTGHDDKAYVDLEKEIATFKRQSFIFRNAKEYKFISPLQRKHKATYDIEKIEFFIEGVLFARVSL